MRSASPVGRTKPSALRLTPAVRDSNDGAVSFSSSVISRNERLVEADGEVAPEDFERRLALDAQRAWPRQRAFDLDLEEVGRAALELHGGVEVGLEGERVELDQHVVADLPVDAEAGGARHQLGARAELERVRGEREVALAAQPKVFALAQADGDALKRREVRGRLEGRVEAADRE